MTKYEAYRVWTKDGKYEVVVATNRVSAVNRAVLERKVKREDIKAVGKATQHGRLFAYPFR